MTTNHYANGFVPNWRNRHHRNRCFFPLGCTTCLGKARAREVYATTFCAPVTAAALDVVTTVLDRLTLLDDAGCVKDLTAGVAQLGLGKEQPSKKLTWDQMQKKLKRERKKQKALTTKSVKKKKRRKKKK